MKIEIQLLPGVERLVALHAAELPQKTELCGAFWGLLALRSAGVDLGNGQPLDQDEVAHLAGAAISREPADGPLPPGEAGRVDYRIDLPRLTDSEITGMSSTGLTRALRELSLEGLAVLPVTGPWTADSVVELMRIVTEEPGVVCPIANVATKPLWHSRVALPAALQYLIAGDDRHESSEWDVGHFVGLFGSIPGPGGTLVLVADTYASLGLDGVHVQPASRLAQALDRPDGNGGGVLIVVRADRADPLKEALAAKGFGFGPWDNGSLDMRQDAS